MVRCLLALSLGAVAAGPAHAALSTSFVNEYAEAAVRAGRVGDLAADVKTGPLAASAGLEYEEGDLSAQGTAVARITSASVSPTNVGFDFSIDANASAIEGTVAIANAEVRVTRNLIVDRTDWYRVRLTISGQLPTTLVQFGASAHLHLTSYDQDWIREPLNGILPSLPYTFESSRFQLLAGMSYQYDFYLAATVTNLAPGLTPFAFDDGVTLQAASSLSLTTPPGRPLDGNDFLAWQRHKGTSAGASEAQGDYSGDGDVDADDLRLWRFRFGGLLVGTNAVPEPSHVALILAAAAAWGVFARRRQWGDSPRAWT